MDLHPTTATDDEEAHKSETSTQVKDDAEADELDLQADAAHAAHPTDKTESLRSGVDGTVALVSVPADPEVAAFGDASMMQQLAAEDVQADIEERLAQSGSLPEKLEALMFVASESLPIEKLARLTGASEEEITTALAELEAHYAERGINVRVVAGGYRFATAPRVRGVVEAYLLPPKTSLSPAALETLAIVAYSQPVTKADIEAVRGVSVDGVVASLVERGLIVEVGRKESLGKPILFGTTAQFLEAFGLPSLADLPALPDEHVDRLQTETASPAILEGTIDDEADQPEGSQNRPDSSVAHDTPEAEVMTQTLIRDTDLLEPQASIDPIDPIQPIEPDPVQPVDPTVPMQPVEPPLVGPQDEHSLYKSDEYADAVETYT